jgi:uncharacterized protein YjbI with pentapeptide repeats
MKIRVPVAGIAAATLAAGMLAIAGSASAAAPVAAADAATTVTPVAGIDQTPDWVKDRLASASISPRMAVRTGKCDLNPRADCKDKDMRHLKDKMKGKDMSGSDMSGADMRGMDLRGTNFTNSDLTGAKLEGAKMEGAKMKGAMVMKVDMSGMKLHKMHMQGANIMYSNLNGATITNSKMKNAVMMKTSMKKTTIKNTDMSWSVLDGGLPAGAVRQSRVLRASPGVGVNIENSGLAHAWWSNFNSTSSRWTGNDLHWTGFQNANMSYMYINDNSYFETTFIGSSDLRRTTFAGNQWGSQYLYNNNLSGTECYGRQATDRKLMSLEAQIKYRNDGNDVYVGNTTYQQYVGAVIDTSQWWFKQYIGYFDLTLGGNTIDSQGVNNACDFPRPGGLTKYFSNGNHP